MLFFVNNFSFSFKITWLYACRSRLALSPVDSTFCMSSFGIQVGRDWWRYFVNRWDREAGVLKGGFCFSW